MSSNRSSRLFGIADLALLITTACWGLNFVITKSAAGNAPDQFRIFIYNLIRFPLASILLFLTVKLKGGNILIRRKYLGAIALISFVGIFAYQVLYMIGQTMTDAANIGIIYSFSPLLILVISVISRIEKPTVFTYFGVVLGVLGLMIILFEGGNLSIDFGSLLFFLAVICWACYSVFAKPVLEHYPPDITIAWMLLFGSLYMLPLALYQLPAQSWGTLSGQNILYVIISALFSLYTGYTLFYYAIMRIGPVKAGIYTNLTPVFTLIFAATIRNETIRMIQVFGLAVIITGIFVTKIHFKQTADNEQV